MTFRTWTRPVVAAGLLLAAAGMADAGHFTTYLGYVETAISDRLATIGKPDTKLEAREVALLKAAAKDLAKNSTKLSQDLNLLALALVHLRQLSSGMAPGMPNNVSLSLGMLSQELDMNAMSVEQGISTYEAHGGKAATVRTLRNWHRQGWALFQKAADAGNHQQRATLFHKSAEFMEKAAALLAKVQPS